MAKKKSFLYMHTTKIEPEKTAADLTKMLLEHGATGVRLKAKGGELLGIDFEMEIEEGKTVPISLPVRPEAVMIQLEEAKYAPGKPYVSDASLDQAKRTAWRMVLRWVEAQLSYVATGQVKTIEVFMPYMLTKTGETLFELAESGGLVGLGKALTYEGK